MRGARQAAGSDRLRHNGVGQSAGSLSAPSRPTANRPPQAVSWTISEPCNASNRGMLRVRANVIAARLKSVAPKNRLRLCIYSPHPVCSIEFGVTAIVDHQLTAVAPRDRSSPYFWGRLNTVHSNYSGQKHEREIAFGVDFRTSGEALIPL